jgi:putative colanic acid biosynthesis acetyltransferase WcaF
MTNRSVDLSRAGIGGFSPGRSRLLEAIWIIIDAVIIDNRANVFSGSRVFLLRLFGATIGRNCRFLHATRVKYPWKLSIGDNCWIGEGVVFYNHDNVAIGNNVCISQETFIASGSHDLTNMDLTLAPIVIKDGVWISSRCFIQKGVTIGANVVVTPNSVIHKSLADDGIYGGNPCKFLRSRWENRERSAV